MIDSFFFTVPGGREHNEDAIGQREIPGGTLFLLADGLGVRGGRRPLPK